MRLKRCFLAIAGASMAALVGYGRGAEAPTTATSAAQGPTTQPTTHPVVFSVRGRITIAGGFEFQKPDLARVVVYMASDPVLDAIPFPSKPAEVGQRKKAFVPNFVVIPQNTEVEFPNWDRFDHNVFSRSKAAPAFDLDRYPYGQSKTRRFTKVGVVQVFCNIHPFMRATIVVTPNNFFARADAQGRFELSGLPAGRYELVAWQERCQEQRRWVVIGAGKSDEISFALSENRKSILANDPPERHGGYGVDRGLGIKRERLDLPVVKDAHPAPGPTQNP